MEKNGIFSIFCVNQYWKQPDYSAVFVYSGWLAGVFDSRLSSSFLVKGWSYSCCPSPFAIGQLESPIPIYTSTSFFIVARIRVKWLTTLTPQTHTYFLHVFLSTKCCVYFPLQFKKKHMKEYKCEFILGTVSMTKNSFKICLWGLYCKKDKL
jgi:hypothetical protein